MLVRGLEKLKPDFSILTIIWSWCMPCWRSSMRGSLFPRILQRSAKPFEHVLVQEPAWKFPLSFLHPTIPSAQSKQKSPGMRRRVRGRNMGKRKSTILSDGAFWWGKVDSNHRSDKQQIYSLSPLATREFPQLCTLCVAQNFFIIARKSEMSSLFWKNLT